MPLPASYLGGFVPANVKVGRLATDDNVMIEPVPAYIMKQTFTNPSTIDTNGVSEIHLGAAAAGTTESPIDGDLATDGVATLTPARNVVITVTHASSVVAMSGLITGTRFGRTLTETWSVTATGTTKTYTGKKAFDTITSITEVVAADASGNSIIVGDGKVLGLDFKNVATTAIKELEDGAAPTAGVLVAGVAASATVDPRGTYTPNSTLNGALDFQVWYLVDDLRSIY
jgi:hypothetical protein